VATTATRDPTSDEAVSGTWSGSAGSRWTLVDDYPSASSADALTHGTTAGNITFGYSVFAIPAGSINISVQVLYYDGEASNGANNIGGRLKVGGNYYNAATHNPSGTGGTSRSDNWATNPKTSAAWTVDDINGVGTNALQAFGLVSTDANPTCWCSSIRLQVTYDPPSEGSLTATVPAPTASATGTVDVQGTLTATVTAPTVTGTGTVENTGFNGTLTATVPAPTVSASGTVDVQGSLSATVPAPTVSASGTVDVQGSLSATVPAPTASASGTVDVQGALTGTVAPTLIGTGTVDVQGALTATVPAPTSTGTGQVPSQGSLTTTVPAPTVTGTGIVEDPYVSGTLSTMVPAPTVSGTGAVAVQGSLTATVSVTLTAAGEVPVTEMVGPPSLVMTVDGPNLSSSVSAARVRITTSEG
jgi:hypothetical protein